MKASTLTEYAAFVGIDWADRKHDVCLQPAGRDQREFSALPHRPERMAQWAQALRQRFEGRPIAVCLELRKGPLVYALQPYNFLVLFPVNQKTPHSPHWVLLTPAIIAALHKPRRQRKPRRLPQA